MPVDYDIVLFCPYCKAKIKTICEIDKDFVARCSVCNKKFVIMPEVSATVKKIEGQEDA